MDFNIMFYIDLYWVKMRALARGEKDLAKIMEGYFPELADPEIIKQLEFYGRLREKLTNTFTTDELKSLLKNPTSLSSH